MAGGELPPGFVRFQIRDAEVVAREAVVESVREALRDGTLYEFGARHSRSRRLAGRGVAYAVPLPGDAGQGVIRHNRHGGAFAAITGDRFLAPTRAGYELHVSEQLRTVGVPTPMVLAYAVYRAGPLFRRADVVTREVPDSVDLSTAITNRDGSVRTSALAAAAWLVAALSSAGAHHHDLNVRNVLLQRGPAGVDALVLDVDRVVFRQSVHALTLEHNLARLARSARKWRVRFGAAVTEDELAAMAELARELLAQRDAPWARVP